MATLAGRVPQRGEVIVHPDGFEFEVIEADPRRIRRLRIRPPARPAETTDAAAGTTAAFGGRLDVTARCGPGLLHRAAGD